MDNLFLSYADFKEMFTGKVNFLQFSGLVAAIKKHMQQNNKIIIIDFNIRCPSTINLIFQSKKCCKKIYNILISKKKSFSTSESEYGFKMVSILVEKNGKQSICFLLKQLQKQNYNGFNVNFKCFTDYLLQTNYLNKCAIRDSPLCSYCNQLPETKDHLFSECFLLKDLWIEMENWLKSTLDIDIDLNRNSILFGKINNLENLIILTIQYYIYPDKFTTSKKLSFEKLKKNVINRLCIEKFVLLKNCKYKEFNNCLRNVFTKY